VTTLLYNPNKSGEALKGVIFDKDGTLLDLNATWGTALAESALDSSDYPEQAELIAQALGIDLANKAFLPNSPIPSGNPETVSSAIANFVDPVGFAKLAQSIALKNVRVADGAHELLLKLQTFDLKMAIATNDSEASALEFLELFSWQNMFDTVVGFDSGYGFKPDPNMILACAKHMQLEPENLIMIGDSLADLEASKGAGVFYIHIGDLLTDALPDAAIKSLSEVIDLLQQT
jgi:phosphoglycolate phosphatase